MVKSLKTDKINGVADIEIHIDELENIVQSVYDMTDKVKKELLENLPSSEEGRKRLDDYAALKEDLRKILEGLIEDMKYDCHRILKSFHIQHLC